MVRSQWIGPVFGVLALTGLAWGQTTPIAAEADGTKDRYVIVQEAGKPPQRCKVLKTWTNKDGNPAYQAQALDTGELMTIVETGPASPRPASQTRSTAMHIFHWGWNAPVPVGTPEPPPNAVVVGYPIDLRPTQPQTPRVASVPPPAPKPRGFWPSPFAQINVSDLNVSAGRLPPPPPAIAPTAQAAPPAKKVELAPMKPAPETVVKAPAAHPAAMKPAVVVAAPVAPAPTSPYAMKPAPETVVKAPDAHPAAMKLGAVIAAPVAPPPTSPYAMKPAAIVAAPAPTSPYATKPAPETVVKAPDAHPAAMKPAVVVAAPVAPAPTSPYAMKPAAIVAAPAPTSPYATKPAPETVVKAPDAHPAESPWWVSRTTAGKPPAPAVAVAPAAPASPTWVPTQPPVKHTQASPVAKAPDPTASWATTVWKPYVAATPPAPPKEPVVAKKVETTVPPPSDWRQSWGKVETPPTPPTPPKVALPHAEPRVADPLRTPDQFAKIPQTGGFAADPPPSEKKAPLLAALALEQPPATLRPEVKEPQPHAAPNPPTPPAHPAPPVVVSKPVPVLTPAPTVAVAKPAPILNPAPTPAPAVANMKLAPLAKPEAAPPAVPLGLGSVLAASSPELAAPAAPAAQGKDAVGVRADEPNAFTDRPKSGDVASAPNAFSAPAPDAPPPDALAMNAFPTPPPTAPSYAPAAVAIRTAPRPTATAPQMPTGYVVPAGFHTESGYDLTQLSSILRDSLYPSQREWAAESLASMDWHRQPQIVDLLVERAKQDPAPTVRAECVRSLGRIKADTPAAVEAIKALRSDSDDRVRQAADEAAGSTR